MVRTLKNTENNLFFVSRTGSRGLEESQGSPWRQTSCLPVLCPPQFLPLLLYGKAHSVRHTRTKRSYELMFLTLCTLVMHGAACVRACVRRVSPWHLFWGRFAVWLRLSLSWGSFLHPHSQRSHLFSSYRLCLRVANTIIAMTAPLCPLSIDLLNYIH